MPQIIVIVLFAVGGWMLYRKFVNDAQKLAKKSRQQAREEENGAHGTLVMDPKTGEYRPKKDDE
jgi:membrane protein implicated in regulation of membrane protease activity